VEVRWPLNHFHSPDPIHVYFVTHGYAVVLVDVRGTGASFGSRVYPWHEEELKDGAQLVEWIAAQPWSDGKVGAYGAGYEGSSAELLAGSGRPALKAVLPLYSEFDTYDEIALPGGLFDDWFVKNWSYFTVEMCQDRLPKEVGAVRMFAKGVSPVNGAAGRDRLAQAVDQHRENVNLYNLAQKIAFRDSVATEKGASGSINDFTVFRRRASIERAGVPICAWGSWMEGASANGVIRRFLTYKNPVRGVIGAWPKSGSENDDPFASTGSAPSPALKAQYSEYLRFFDRTLRGEDTGKEPERVLQYYTMGEGKWKETTVWPPKGSAPQRWYFAADRALSTQAPSEAEGVDTYAVDFAATTGSANRWHSHLLGTPVRYPDRAGEDARLLTYTAPPLAKDTEITGHPVVTLYVTSTEKDGAFFVYLEDVTPDGRVLYLTEGELRAEDRKVAPEKAPYICPTPYHSFEKADAVPLTPGETAELAFGLQPISVRVPAGHRLRVAIAGSDADTFARVPEKGTPTVTVARSKAHASWIDLPVVGK
jgi:putative CocE/NonD family hydrolase